jgi:hypothetical protein
LLTALIEIVGGKMSVSGKWQVFSTGGTAIDPPRWRGDGKELFYVAAGQKLMAVPVQTVPFFQFGTPVPLFEMRGSWHVRADSQRFLASLPSQAQNPEPQQVVVNWTAALPKRK